MPYGLLLIMERELIETQVADIEGQFHRIQLGVRGKE